MAIDPKTGRRGVGDKASMGMADNYVSSILPQPDGKPLIGLYIGGVIKPKDELRLNKKDISKQGKKDKSVAKNDFPKLPSVIKPPTIDELKLMQTKLEKLNKPLPKVYAAYYGEDWKTQGDWYGRVTSEYGILCAMNAPMDHTFYWADIHYRVTSFMGPNHTGDDSLRYWLHWRRTSDRRSLWDVRYGFYRQAEWDDHGETYPWTLDGPDVWYLLDVRHEGVFEVNMYFFNKDGHTGNNRMRDYLLEVFPSPMAWKGVFEDRPMYAKMAENQVTKMPPLARSRMHDFWGGVHKTFVVTGPGSYFFKIDRNYSFNAIISAVMIRQIHGEPTWLAKVRPELYCMGKVPYNPPPFPNAIQSEYGLQVINNWTLLNEKYGSKDSLKYQREYRIKTYIAADRAANYDFEMEQLSKSLKWRLNQWDEEQRKEYTETMLRGWRAYFLASPAQRTAIERNRSRFPEIYKEPRYDIKNYPELMEKQ
jgi:hypothetical protein